MSKTRRIFDIAKELNISHIEIIDFLDTKGIKGSTNMSSVPNELYAEIVYNENVCSSRCDSEMSCNYYAWYFI